MIRRALGVAAGAAALALVPTSALAYNEVGDVPGSVAQGVPFNITLDGPNENAYFGLSIASANVPDSAIEIAGSQYLEKPTTNGTATFTVTLNEPATYTVVGTAANGEVVLEETVTAGTAAAADGSSSGSGSGASLPDTGSGSTPLLIGAAGLLAAGAGAMTFARRRQAQV